MGVNRYVCTLKKSPPDLKLALPSLVSALSGLKSALSGLNSCSGSPPCSTGHWPFEAAALLSPRLITSILQAGQQLPLTMCDPWMTRCLLSLGSGPKDRCPVEHRGEFTDVRPSAPPPKLALPGLTLNFQALQLTLLL